MSVCRWFGICHVSVVVFLHVISTDKTIKTFIWNITSWLDSVCARLFYRFILLFAFFLVIFLFFFVIHSFTLSLSFSVCLTIVHTPLFLHFQKLLLLLFWIHSLVMLFFCCFHLVCVLASWYRFAFSLNIKKFCSFHWPKRSNNFILSTTTIPSNWYIIHTERGKSKCVYTNYTMMANKLHTNTRTHAHTHTRL